MKWLRTLFGLQTPLEAKKRVHEKLLNQATKSQKAGNLREASYLLSKAEALESEMMKQIISDVAKEGAEIERQYAKRLVKNSKNVS